MAQLAREDEAEVDAGAIRPDGAAPVFHIVMHVSPPVDLGVTHWTEAPECPAANEGGRSADEVLEGTKKIIRAWWQRRTGEPGDRIEFVLLQGN